MCVDMCAITLDTMDLGMGVGDQCPSYPLPPLNRRTPKGREREGIGKAERGKRTCYLQAWTRNLYLQVALKSLPSHWSGNWIQSY